MAAAKQAQQEAGGVEGGPQEVKGFMLGRLRERRPELEQELLTFRDHLMAASSSSEDQTLKVSILTMHARKQSSSSTLEVIGASACMSVSVQHHCCGVLSLRGFMMADGAASTGQAAGFCSLMSLLSCANKNKQGMCAYTLIL